MRIVFSFLSILILISACGNVENQAPLIEKFETSDNEIDLSLNRRIKEKVFGDLQLNNHSDSIIVTVVNVKHPLVYGFDNGDLAGSAIDKQNLIDTTLYVAEIIVNFLLESVDSSSVFIYAFDTDFNILWSYQKSEGKVPGFIITKEKK